MSRTTTAQYFYGTTVPYIRAEVGIAQSLAGASSSFKEGRGIRRLVAHGERSLLNDVRLLTLDRLSRRIHEDDQNGGTSFWEEWRRHTTEKRGGSHFQRPVLFIELCNLNVLLSENCYSTDTSTLDQYILSICPFTHDFIIIHQETNKRSVTTRSSTIQTPST